jgi:hypothetical protein
MKQNIYDVLSEMSLYEKEDVLKASISDYKAYVYDIIYDREPSLINEIMDEIIAQDELLDLDEHPSLTNEERNR